MLAHFSLIADVQHAGPAMPTPWINAADNGALPPMRAK